MAMVDVTVMGAGVFGLSIAWSCARRGAAVRVIDPFGQGAGASGGIVGALAPHVPENWNDKKAFQLESLLMSEAYWNGVDATSGLSSGYARLGRLQPATDAHGLDLARQRAKSAAILWKNIALWEVVLAKDLGNWVPDAPTGWVIRDSLSARLHPRAAVTSLAAALGRKGVDIVKDNAREGHVVWATGVAGLEGLNRDAGRVVGNGIKGQAALLRYDAGDLPQLFADTVHVVPHADGTVAIGSTSEREYDDGTATDSLLDQILERAFAAVPALRGAPVVERWAGVRPRAKSRSPMLGGHPFRPGEFIANGGFKIGFGMAPKVGEVMADLMLDGRDTIPDGFRPEASL